MSLRRPRRACMPFPIKSHLRGCSQITDGWLKFQRRARPMKRPHHHLRSPKVDSLHGLVRPSTPRHIICYWRGDVCRRDEYAIRRGRPPVGSYRWTSKVALFLGRSSARLEWTAATGSLNGSRRGVVQARGTVGVHRIGFVLDRPPRASVGSTSVGACIGPGVDCIRAILLTRVCLHRRSMNQRPQQRCRTASDQIARGCLAGARDSVDIGCYWRDHIMPRCEQGGESNISSVVLLLLGSEHVHKTWIIMHFKETHSNVAFCHCIQAA